MSRLRRSCFTWLMRCSMLATDLMPVLSYAAGVSRATCTTRFGEVRCYHRCRSFGSFDHGYSADLVTHECSRHDASCATVCTKVIIANSIRYSVWKTMFPQFTRFAMIFVQQEEALDCAVRLRIQECAPKRQIVGRQR